MTIRVFRAEGWMSFLTALELYTILLAIRSSRFSTVPACACFRVFYPAAMANLWLPAWAGSSKADRWTIPWFLSWAAWLIVLALAEYDTTRGTELVSAGGGVLRDKAIFGSPFRSNVIVSSERRMRKLQKLSHRSGEDKGGLDAAQRA